MELTKGMILFIAGIGGTAVTLLAIFIYILLTKRSRKKLMDRLNAIYGTEKV